MPDRPYGMNGLRTLSSTCSSFRFSPSKPIMPHLVSRLGSFLISALTFSSIFSAISGRFSSNARPLTVPKSSSSGRKRARSGRSSRVAIVGSFRMSFSTDFATNAATPGWSLSRVSPLRYASGLSGRSWPTSGYRWTKSGTSVGLRYSGGIPVQ